MHIKNVRTNNMYSTKNEAKIYITNSKVIYYIYNHKCSAFWGIKKIKNNNLLKIKFFKKIK